MLASSIFTVTTLAFSVHAAPAPIANADANANVGLLDFGTLSETVEIVESLLDSELESTKFPKIFKKNPELFKLHADLVKIESISHDEFAVSRYLQSYLEKLDLGLQLSVDPSNRNIYAYGGANNGNSTVLLTSHIDAVPPFVDYYIEEDFDDEKESVKIHGRGSCDAKGSVAAQIIAAKELLEDGLVTLEDLSLLFVFEEEVGGTGMRSANAYFNHENITWDAVIFGEPTENKLATGHKGLYMAELEVYGFASHSGYPDIGNDANKILIEIMHELETYTWPSSELLNKTTLNIGLINAGVADNVISPYAQCKLLLRTAVEYKEIDIAVKEIIAKYESLANDLKLSVLVTDDPVTLDFEVNGFETYIAAYATDIPKLDHKNFKRYLYGPGSILVAHGPNEYVAAESLLQAVEDYKKLVLFSLGK